MFREESTNIEKNPHVVRIHIDQKPYESANPTTGEKLYQLGNVKSGFELYQEVAGNHEDPSIENGPQAVHLKEDDHFHSGPPKEFTIIVNARKKTVTTKRLSFDAIIKLAFDPVPTGNAVMFTITYDNGPKANPAGTLMPGGTVKIKEGMVFCVTATDKS